MALQRNPDVIVWMTLADGTLISMTYEREQNVIAFARHIIGGVDGVLSRTFPETTATDYPLLNGTDDQADPGLTQTTAIYNVTQLQAMNDDKTGNYYLANDIDASDTVNWNTGQGFKPIAAGDGDDFTGTFDGNGYTISDLFVNWGQTAWTTNGLFGTVASTAKIANVTLTDVDVTGNLSNTGALAGFVKCLNTGGSEPVIQNCHASGTVKTTETAGGYTYIGGLIGLSEGNDDPLSVQIKDCSSSCTVTGYTSATSVTGIGGLIGAAKQTVVSNCFATGTVTGGLKARYCGGLVGFTSDASGSNSGCDFSYCYATGDVSGQGDVGGLLGNNGNAPTIGTCVKCYATGDVTAAATTPTGASYAYLGGLIGYNAGDITDCYAWGDVTSASTTSKAGGFIGEHPTLGVTVPKAILAQCYSIGAASGVDSTGGFTAVGGDPVITNCYWDTEASGNATSSTGLGQLTEWLKTQANYPASWDFDTIWYMGSDVTAAYSGRDTGCNRG
jgi:hypothetical protein